MSRHLLAVLLVGFVIVLIATTAVFVFLGDGNIVRVRGEYLGAQMSMMAARLQARTERTDRMVTAFKESVTASPVSIANTEDYGVETFAKSNISDAHEITIITTKMKDETTSLLELSVMRSAEDVLRSTGSLMMSSVDSVWFLSKSRNLVSVQASGVSGGIEDYIGQKIQSGGTDIGPGTAAEDGPKQAVGVAYSSFLRRWGIFSTMPVEYNGTWVGTVGFTIFLSSAKIDLSTDIHDNDVQLAIDDHGVVIMNGDADPMSTDGSPFGVDVNRSVASVMSSIGDRKWAVVEFRGEKWVAARARVNGIGLNIIRLSPVPAGFDVMTYLLYVSGIGIAFLVLAGIIIFYVERRQAARVQELVNQITWFKRDGTIMGRSIKPQKDEIGDLCERLDTLFRNYQLLDRKYRNENATFSRRLENMNELAARRRSYLAQFSYEFRTYLNSVTGFSSLLKVRLHDKDDIGYIDAVIESADNALISLNVALGATSAGEDAKREVLSLASPVKLMQEAILHARQTVNKVVEINSTVTPEEDDILCRPMSLKRILTILLAYGIGRTDVGGKITISLDADEGDLMISCTDEGGYLPPLEVDRLLLVARETGGQIPDRIDMELTVAREIAIALGGAFDVIGRLSGIECRIVIPRSEKAGPTLS